MPPRRHPRLKPFVIVCSLPDCRVQKTRYYPRRPSVAAKANPGGRTYCSKAHAQRDWSRRRRREAAEPTACAWQGCTNEIPPSHRPGRPRSYCSDRCKGKAAAERSHPVPVALQAAQARVATLKARVATLKEKAVPARQAANTFRGRLDGTVASAEAAARYPARLRDWKQSEPKPPGPAAPKPIDPKDAWTTVNLYNETAVDAERSARVAYDQWEVGERQRSEEQERYVVDHDLWQKAEPPTPRENARSPEALREALPGWRSKLAGLDATARAFESDQEQAKVDLEQAEAAVEHFRLRLAKRAADAKARRAADKSSCPTSLSPSASA